MTTFTIPGIFFTTDINESATFFAPASVSFVLAPGVNSVSYGYDDAQNGDPTTIQLNNTGTENYGFVLDSDIINPNFNGFVIQVQWSDGGDTRTTILLTFETGFFEQWAFAIGGDPLPNLGSLADLNAFRSNVVDVIDVPPGGSFSAGVPIPLATIPGVLTTENDVIDGTFGDDVLLGGAGDDVISGFSGNDYINPGDNNTSWDRVIPGTGNDTVDMQDVAIGFVGIEHFDLNQGIAVTIDGNANTGTINKGTAGTTTLLDVANPILSGAGILGGLGIYGTAYNDSFNVRSADGGWMMVRGGFGADSYTILASEGEMRLDFAFANQGMVADFTAGTITNDGWGFTETITGFENVTEVRGTRFTDDLTGTDDDFESWILEGGNDTLNAGGGWDRLRFDRDGVEAVEVDLQAGNATGTWDGIAFSASISGIEEVRGSNEGNDILSGDGFDNVLDGRGGDDRLEGRGGDDTLFGGDGEDSIEGGAGNDRIYGGIGEDVAVFEGRYDEYTVTGDSLGTYTVVSNRSADTGTDLLFEIEKLQFANGVLSGTVFTADNSAPALLVDDQTVGVSEWILLSDVLAVTDEDGDTNLSYEIWDSQGGNNWWADGGVVDASTGYVTADLSDIWFQGDAAVGSQTLWVRANDGTEWGAWDSFTLTTAAANTPPVATVEDQTSAPLVWTELSDVLTTLDADDDPIVSYEIWDSQGGNNWWADGAVVDATIGYVTSDLSGIWFQGDATPGSQTLWVRANDGTDWGAWDSFTLTTAAANTPPVATVEEQTTNLLEWTQLLTVLTTSDANNDEIVLYEVWDDQGGNNWWADGGVVDASAGHTTSDLSDIWFQGDAATGNQTLWVRANDGTEWGAWDNFDLITV